MPPLPSTSLITLVVCAWPVSGQYGPGSRVLYYVLIAACVFARKMEWLRNACIAAALLFPAVAALHAIVLAAISVNDAVDMDIYGAFQLCSLGILAAPVTVRLSRTYFYDPGRNTIFLWTGLILAGLLSLTVVFFRIQTSDCTHDDSGNPISPLPGDFLYQATCGLTCSIDQGPYSPMRRGSANNIYVIPAPDRLPFGMATLLAAACCIPAILSLISMWNKILEINWKTRFGNRDEDEQINEPIEGTNGATIKKMRGVNAVIGLFLGVVEVPVFGAAVLAILIIGEMNFSSAQVKYQTEPIASIGQWAPIVGAGLAVLSSLLLATDSKTKKEEVNANASTQHCNCSMQEAGTGTGPFIANSYPVATPGAEGRGQSSEIEPTNTRTTSRTVDAGSRLKVAKTLTAISNHLGTAAHGRFDDSDFKRGKALDYPEVPGEEHRNRALPQIREHYNQSRDGDGNITPVFREHSSRAASVASRHSHDSVEGSSTTPRATSPQSTRSLSPLPSPTTPRRPNSLSSPSSGLVGDGLRQRRDTLEVPSPVRHGHSHKRINSSISSITSVIPIPGDQNSSTVGISADLDTSTPTITPVTSLNLPIYPLEPLPISSTAVLRPSAENNRQSTP